jgi:DNA-binding NarL/FixJ family response regulator
MINTTDTIRGSRRIIEGEQHVPTRRTDRSRTTRQDEAHRHEDLQRALRERLKELNCLYEISRLIDSHGNSLEPILQGIVEILPSSWQYPEICCARLTLHDEEHATTNFRRTVWRQSAEIHVNGEPAGAVEVCYLREMPEVDEGPFLREERELITAVAERAGKIVERVQIQRQLEADRAALQESNTALRRVLAQIDEEKNDFRHSISANVDMILEPILRAMEGELPVSQKGHVSLLRKHLSDLVSPFANRLSKAFSTLTPIEIEICSMIRDGLTTKEIAQIRHVAPKTVGKQRERIRKKLLIPDSRVNLATHLRMFASDAEGETRVCNACRDRNEEGMPNY